MRAFVLLLLVVCICGPGLAPAADSPAVAQDKRKAATPGKTEANAPAKQAKRKATPARKVVTKSRPARPLAAFVPRVEAEIQHGCVEAREIQAAANKIGIAQHDVENLFSGSQPPPGSAERACVDYALALLPAGHGSSLAVLDSKVGREGAWATIIRSQANGDIASTREALSNEDWRELRIPAFEVVANGADSIRGLSYNLQWEVGVLVKHMTAGIDSLLGYQVRIVLQNPSGEPYEKIVALELIQSATQRVIDSVVWLDRQGDVGAYFNLKGDNYERLFWESPVDFSRISRGTGRSAVTIKRRVAVKASGKKTMRFVNRSFRYRGHHVGIDFAAPIGETVRAVADAEVVFAGTRGGYGNLVVLEHGQNYQTYYAHLSRFADGLTVGQKILRGEEIGFVGTTGVSTGPHLHFEIRKENQYFDPLAKQNNLSLWNLYPEEHARLLARIVALDITRPGKRLSQALVPPPN